MVDPAAMVFPETGHPDVHPEPDPGLLLLAPDGAHALGPPTVDSDLDGRADTAVVDEPDALLLATDLDGDTHVDVVTALGADGTVVTHDTPDPWNEGVPPPAPVIDPVTGHWIRLG